jgi:hypothetical protein
MIELLSWLPNYQQLPLQAYDGFST